MPTTISLQYTYHLKLHKYLPSNIVQHLISLYLQTNKQTNKKEKQRPGHSTHKNRSFYHVCYVQHVPQKLPPHSWLGVVHQVGGVRRRHDHMGGGRWYLQIRCLRTAPHTRFAVTHQYRNSDTSGRGEGIDILLVMKAFLVLRTFRFISEKKYTCKDNVIM